MQHNDATSFGPGAQSTAALLVQGKSLHLWSHHITWDLQASRLAGSCRLQAGIRNTGTCQAQHLAQLQFASGINFYFTTLLA